MDPIDLNADLGKGYGRWTLTDDDARLSVVTSANVACGFHAGDPSTMRRVCERAVEVGVRIGSRSPPAIWRDSAGAGPPLHRAVPDELPSEGVVLGAVQVPADGQPLILLADHPTTGGYPVVAVIDDADVDRCAQARPGTAVHLTPA